MDWADPERLLQARAAEAVWPRCERFAPDRGFGPVRCCMKEALSKQPRAVAGRAASMFGRTAMPNAPVRGRLTPTRCAS